MKVAAIQSNYLPWKGYFDIIHDVDVFVFYDDVKYTKNDWRNRNKIYANGRLSWLTIPIYPDAVKQKISQVELRDEKWQDSHHNALCQAYRRAPQFDQLKMFIDELYQTTQWNKLIDVNRFSIKKICEHLQIKTEFRDLAEFTTPDGRIDRLLSVLEQLHATTYVTGPSARNYMTDADLEKFRKKKIEVVFKNYGSYAPYNQGGFPHEPFVSIVDMIAHLPYEQIADLTWRTHLS